MPLKLNQQKIALHMLHNSHKINFFDQDVYKDFRVFKQEMQLLKNADLVNLKTIQKDGKFIIEYSLSSDGLIFFKLLDMVNKKLII